MSFINKVSGMQLDILKEIGNIGAGHAATALSVMLDKKVEMNVPDVQVVTFDEMMELAGGAESLAAGIFLRIEGDAPGSMFFMLPIRHAERFIREMIGDSGYSIDSAPPNEIALSALQELGNILSGAYLSSLSDFTNLALYPSVPALSIDMAGAIISFGLIELSQAGDYAIVINTVLNDLDSEDEEIVQGSFFLLPDPESFQTIFKALGVSENG
ncbi:chemotaxis protein CheC [Mesobacillus harenae]|uniref:chemotaxis protein CheC n=1 Tax=Mesobacillus harenae TaxID=2213203 RepID=UPI0015801C8A|nr:chemotaxis protein CheC [Mesobacillus harenae]